METGGLPSGGCGDSSAERKFPSDKVYRRNVRGVIRGRALHRVGLRVRRHPHPLGRAACCARSCPGHALLDAVECTRQKARSSIWSALLLVFPAPAVPGAATTRAATAAAARTMFLHVFIRVHPVVVSVPSGCDNVRPHPPVPLFCWRVRARSAKSPPHRRNWCERANLANDHHHSSEPVFKPRRTPSFFADTFPFNV